MKVLVVGPDRNDPGGVANYYNSVFPRISDNSITAQYLEIGRTHGQRRLAYAILDQVRFWRTVCQFCPDVIHLNPSLNLKSFLRDGLFIIIAKTHRKSVLVFFRGWDESFEKDISGRFKWFFKNSYYRTDMFIVLAKKFAARLRDWGVTAPIFLGTTAVADELLEEVSINDKVNEIKKGSAIRILFLARLEQAKGVLELIDAIEELLKGCTCITLTIAGDGPIMTQVRERVENLGQYKDCVQVVGYVRGNVKKEILRSHHIFCFPSHYPEGMPNSVLEAMAFGMPVITCPVGGIPDFFEDNMMGKLLIERNAQHISDAIVFLASNRSRLANIARYNYHYAQDHFLASTAADMLRLHYYELIND